MEIKCGFVEFYDKADKGINDFFKEANNKDFLGLRKLNIRISNMLFPIGHTLMPTLVYIYYLNAIYHVLWNKNNGKEPKADEINKWEMAISQNIVKQENVKEKGFLNEAKVRAFTYYKSNMEKMHYFKQEWKADDCLKVSALELLKNTGRYKFVYNLIKDNEKPPEKIDFRDILIDRLDDVERLDFLIDRLDDVERLDFIRRAVLPYDGEYSVFSNIVMYHCGIKQKPRKGITIYNDDWMYKYNNEIKTMSDLENFYCLESCFKEIQRNRYSDYKMALQYSKLQWIAKLAYNMCLFENNDDKRNDYKARLEEFIKDPQNNIDEKYLKKLEKLDENLDDAVQFISNIYEIIKDKDKVTVIDKLKELVRNRERDVMGDASILGSGIIVENPMGYYIDTFRWQYRAEDGDEDGDEESANVKDNTNELKVPVWKSGDEKNLRNRCASYYIYELFYEPYEENKQV